MSACVVWMDSGGAKIFHIVGDEITGEQSIPRNLPRSERLEDVSSPEYSEVFFAEVVRHLSLTRDGVLLVGPEGLKDHFATYFDNQRDPRLAARLVGLETMPMATDPQILTCARKHFAVGEFALQ